MLHVFYQSGFRTFSTELLHKQSVVVSLLERVLVSWSLAMDEHGGHKDLRGSDHQSVIPYVHRITRVILLKPALPKSTFSSAPVKRRMSEPFIAQDRTVTLRSGTQHVVL
jgi:hypothetical protein